ncbi:MAG: ion transporter [Oscillospiraceae bacterium]|jgi:voltage-gated potassium channel|nr:ion transporter [Oscillospiraceae bacterium]
MNKIKEFKSKAYKIVYHKNENRKFRFVMVFLIVLNLLLMSLETLDLSPNEKFFIRILDIILDFFFLSEFLLKFWTSNVLYHNIKLCRARAKYLFSVEGLADFLSIWPMFLPNIVPESLEILRIVRIFSVLKINGHTRIFDRIILVLKNKSKELKKILIAEFFFISASSIVMYHIEHAAQPTVFKNIFSAFWWTFVAITTIGYGDIYPITPLGKLFSIIIFITGITLVAVPTAIITSEFINQKKIRSTSGKICSHCGKRIKNQ